MFNAVGVLCLDIDECALGICSQDSTCNNTEGGFNCSCNNGFYGDGINCNGMTAVCLPSIMFTVVVVQVVVPKLVSK